VNTANRRAARHAEEPLPSGDCLLARGPSPAKEVESRDLVAFLIQKVAAKVGEECAACFELLSLDYKVAEIAEKLALSKRTVYRNLAQAEGVARRYLEAEEHSS
jgi:DNA-directed RNA polymerase specialized sigma24 family protein